MKLNKFLNVGLLAAVTAIAQPALAGTSYYDDFSQSQDSCMVAVNDSGATRMVNISYIRLIKVEKEKENILVISLASNYYNTDNELKISYKSNKDAEKAMVELAEKINDCQYNVQQKRRMK